MLRPEILASITPRNGAYLISFDHHEFFNSDATPTELYDCAASLTTAKRVAKEMAREAGCTHLQWVPGGSDHGYPANTTLLLGVAPDEVGY